MESLWIAEKDELDGYSTVFSSLQKQQLQNFLSKEYGLERETKNNKNTNNDKIESVKEEYANLARELRMIRSELYKYIEIGYVKYNDLRRDIHGNQEEHIQYLDENLSMILEKYIHSSSEFLNNIPYIWFDRCSKKEFSQKQKKEYLAEQNENKRLDVLKKYQEQVFKETFEILQECDNNNFFVQIIINFYEQIYI